MSGETKAELIADIRKRLPLVRIGYPELADDIERVMGAVELEPASAARLAEAMLEAKAGASGPFDGKEQLRQTRLMAEWIIARLPFHGLALVDADDGLTDDEREDRYRQWLYNRSVR